MGSIIISIFIVAVLSVEKRTNTEIWNFLSFIVWVAAELGALWNRKKIPAVMNKPNVVGLRRISSRDYCGYYYYFYIRTKHNSSLILYAIRRLSFSNVIKSKCFFFFLKILLSSLTHTHIVVPEFKCLWDLIKSMFERISFPTSLK